MNLNSARSVTRGLTLIASFTGLNVAARIVLAGGPPNVKPVAFLCLTAGIVGGPLTGFIVGAVTMFISDIYFGAGYWTFINSVCMGIIGFLAGLLWNRRTNIRRTELVVGGFLLTAIYDVATSLILGPLIFGYSWWIAILGLYAPFLTGYAVVYPFGFVHELTTAVLMAAIGPTLISRVRQLANPTPRLTTLPTIAQLLLCVPIISHTPAAFRWGKWTLGTPTTEVKVEVRGCDLFEFRGGKIVREDSDWKIVERT